jgi:hypothetical protein
MALIRLVELCDTPQFIQTYNRELETGKYKSKTACYEALEFIRVKKLNSRKFRNWNSFRVARNIYLSKTNQSN